MFFFSFDQPIAYPLISFQLVWQDWPFLFFSFSHDNFFSPDSDSWYIFIFEFWRFFSFCLSPYANKTAGEEARRQLHKNVASNIEQVLAATSHKAPTIRPPASHPKNYPSYTNQTCRTLLEKQSWAHKWCTPMDPHIWPSKSRTTSSNIHMAAVWGYGM